MNYNNNNNNRRVSHHKKRRAAQKNAVVRLALVAALVMMFAIAIGRSMIVNASDEGKKKENMIRYYTSISIESEDTLWNIAEHYNNGEESDKHYINSLMELNNMNSDTIYSGQNLLVYYYSDEVKE